MMTRAVLVTLLLGSLIFFQHEYGIYEFPAVSLSYFVLFVYILTAIYWYLLGRIKNLPLFAYLQIAGDICVVSLLVHITGGIDSSFSVLYHVVIISASIIIYRRGGYFAASLASILYGGMLDLQYYNLLGFVRSFNFTSIQVLYLVFINILSFYTIAFLSGYLSDRLRKTRQELREKSIDFEDLRALQNHILKSIGSGILTMDLDGNITSWNPAAEQITGYSYSEIRTGLQDIFGKSIKGLFGHTDDLKERPFRFEGQIIKKDGTCAILGMVATLLKDEVNVVRGVILIFQDITKILQMEDQVRRQERLATIGSLAAGIAHEIRNPLASLSGSIQVLQSELDLRGDNKHLMNIVVREADRLNTIITDFLEYARPKPSHNEYVMLSSLLSDTCTLLKNSKELSPGVTIHSDVDPKLIVRGDTQRLRQIFWNVLINACQALPDRGQIDISGVPLYPDQDEPTWGQITIADNGPGIARDDLPRIFDPFFTTKAGGTGLGLAIAHRIIQDHGGTIIVESREGEGTKFEIRIPLVPETGIGQIKPGKTGSRASESVM